MRIHFTKMHGLGNDFVVVNRIDQSFQMTKEHVRQWADRHLGIGCDQLLTIEPATCAEADFFYRIYNSDGSEAQQCGNGVRCVARYVVDHQLFNKQQLRIETHAGIIEAQLMDNDLVRVAMGEPILMPGDIPFCADQQADTYTLDMSGESIEVGVVSMGNPHLVYIVDQVASAPVATWGPLLESHPSFPEQVNVGFMEIVSHNEINLRVFERGVGETLACGTGACAAVVSGRLRHILEAEVTVHLPGGDLQIEWLGKGYPVMMTGPATTVFEGSIGTCHQ